MTGGAHGGLRIPAEEPLQPIEPRLLRRWYGRRWWCGLAHLRVGEELVALLPLPLPGQDAVRELAGVRFGPVEVERAPALLQPEDGCQGIFFLCFGGFHRQL